MIWHYRCPECSQPLEVDWDWHRDEVVCPNCQHSHYPPTPREDHTAYFGGDTWPQEMADAVVALRGTTCAVPGCYEAYATLVHRCPRSKGGRTSVENLLPMCSHHARLKGEQEYDEWLASQPELSPAVKVEPIKITITQKKRPPAPEPSSRFIAFCQPVAGHAKPPLLPADMKLIALAPVLPGPCHRLLLDYDWRLESAGTGRVVLLAWQHTRSLELTAPAGIPDCPQLVNEHSGKAGDSGTGLLELTLDGPGDRRWHVAVALEPGTGQLALDQYLLSLTD
ncbi:MAG: HNH endonuclease signature motif containing protein [candidate division WOR-3 bacterium]